MPKFKIGGSYGYAGTDWTDEIEAETLEDAQEQAWEQAVQQVESYAIELDEDGNERKS